jgi:hypothetical protein
LSRPHGGHIVKVLAISGGHSSKYALLIAKQETLWL